MIYWTTMIILEAKFYLSIVSIVFLEKNAKVLPKNYTRFQIATKLSSETLI